jgi:hypothetical protein
LDRRALSSLLILTVTSLAPVGDPPAAFATTETARRFVGLKATAAILTAGAFASHVAFATALMAVKPDLVCLAVVRLGVVAYSHRC